MNQAPSEIRKAAVFFRSLDGETASALLAQLTTEEAQALRDAVRALGTLEPEEQADVAAEFRRVSPLAGQPTEQGVELRLNQPAVDLMEPASEAAKPTRRFEFLEATPVDVLVPCLTREHPQTVAVALSYLPPSRAAELLAALPPRMQVSTVERLAALGETDPDSLMVLERELAAWVASRHAAASRTPRRPDAVAAILSAAQQTARQGIIANLTQYGSGLASDVARLLPTDEPAPVATPSAESLDRIEMQLPPAAQHGDSTPSERRLQLQFDDLARLSSVDLAAVMQNVDANVLVLALAGSREELVDQIAAQMSRKVAKAFRKQLRRLGPTRLRDVEAAQAAVTAAAESICGRRLRAAATAA